jgi:hypothetical protein
MDVRSPDPYMKTRLIGNCLDLAEDYGKFMADATRLAEDISGNHTFNTVRPLLNFWAAFTPSNEVCYFRKIWKGYWLTYTG